MMGFIFSFNDHILSEKILVDELKILYPWGSSIGTPLISLGTGHVLQGVKTLRATQIRMIAGTGSLYMCRVFVLGQYQLQKCRTKEKSTQLKFFRSGHLHVLKALCLSPFPEG